MEDMRCRYMQAEDIQSVQSLLRENGLPVEGVEQNLSTFLVVEKEGLVIGCGAVEVKGRYGLLRSVAVLKPARSKGVGRLLIGQLFSVACLHGINELFLLSVNSVLFFEKMGFSRIQRGKIPKSIRETEFCTNPCCDAAVSMTKNIRPQAQYYSKETLQLKDDLPGVKMWAVTLEKTMLTYFMVDANSHFEEHHHESEQITMVLSGALYFAVQGERYRVGEGEVITIPSNIRHAVHTLDQPAVAVDAWSPVMEKYR